MKEVTHQDVIDYIIDKRNDTHYELLNGKLIITKWVPFNDFKFSTLPNGIIFKRICFLSNSYITSIPDDIVLRHGLYLSNTKIKTLPVLNVGGDLYIGNMDLVLKDGTYIGGCLSSDTPLYEHLNYLMICGYFFSTGILS